MENLKRKPINVGLNYFRIKLFDNFWLTSYKFLPFHLQKDYGRHPTLKLSNKIIDAGLFFYEDIKKLKQFYPKLEVRSISGSDIIIFPEFEEASVK
jgi:hypothetical protein